MLTLEGIENVESMLSVFKQIVMKEIVTNLDFVDPFYDQHWVSKNLYVGAISFSYKCKKELLQM